MKQPEYFDDGTGRVCRLRRSLYGLKQASRVWYKMLDKFLREKGFNRSMMDAGTYVRVMRCGKPVYVTVFVDDLLIVGSLRNITIVIDELRTKFKI